MEKLTEPPPVFKQKARQMNPHNVATLITCLAAFTVMGCSDATKSSTKQETTITTPGGTAKVTVEKEVKETGDNPPKVAP